MASITHSSAGLADAVWNRFSPAERQRMLEDDRVAATRVSLILTALAATGMILAAITLVAIWLTA